MSQPQQVIVTSTKSVGLAIVLAILFGPLGVFYASVVGGIVMLVISIPVALLTFGLGLLITWPACVIWAGVAANNYNKKLTATVKAAVTD